MTDPETQQQQTHTPTFIGVFVLLCGLTAASYAVASSNMMEQSPGLARGCLIGISAAKAFLVVMFFMHLWWERAWKYVLTLPAIVLATVLVVLMYPDIGKRTDSYSSERDRRAPHSTHTQPDSPEHHQPST